MTVLPTVRTQLVEAVARPRRASWLPGWATPTTALTTATVALTAIIALVALGVGGRSARPPVMRHPPVPMTDPVASMRPLVHEFGVLRRPQRASDLEGPLPAYASAAAMASLFGSGAGSALAQAGHPALIRPLVRTVADPWGDIVTIAPSTYAPDHPGTRIAGITLLMGRGSQAGGLGLEPLPVAAATHGLLVFAFSSPPGTNTGAFLVPDGVREVDLRVLRVTGLVVPFAGHIPPVAVPVRDNVAPFRLTGLTTTTHRHVVHGPWGARALCSIVWRGAGGRIVRQVKDSFDLVVEVR